MRLETFAVALTIAVAPALAHAQAAPLPLKKVRMYETGVAYFERTGVVKGGVSLPVPSGQLDDALKTLVILSTDTGAVVSGVEFASSVSQSMARALAGLPTEGGTAVDYERLLDSMKGAHVELRAGNDSFVGRLVEVIAPAEDKQNCDETIERKDGAVVCKSAKYTTLVLVTDNDEVRRFRSIDVASVRPTERAWRARIDSALDALSQRGVQSRLRVLAKDGKPITLGYVAEAAVWRSTYRLVLDGTGQKADRLQGWALLHNDTDEDWSKVKVELVNGEPDSFLYPLAAPRYARRELVTPQRELSTVPQLLDQTVDNMWSMEGSLGLSGIGEGGGGRGEGIGLGSIGTIGHGAGAALGPAESSLLAVGNLANLAKADGVEQGALFRYALPQPIDLRAHGSALLPFADHRVKVEPITYFEQAGVGGRAAAHLTNDSQQTLPAGPIAIFSDGGFAGETALARTKPKEERILRFGVDLDVELEESVVGTPEKDEPRILRVSGDQLVEHFVHHQTKSYNLTNRSGRARKVYLALRYVQNADVQGAESLAFDDEKNEPLAVFSAPERSTKRYVLKVREGLSRNHPLGDMKARDVGKLATYTSLPTDQRGLLRTAARHLSTVESSRRTIATIKRELRELDLDIARLRANLSASNGHGDELLERLVAAEEKFAQLRRRAAALERRATVQKRLARGALDRLNAVAPAKG